MLEPEALQGAFLAATGETQALMNHLGLAARSAPTAKLVFESDLRASLRRALQFGRQEMVSVESTLSKEGLLAEPTDVVVAGKTKKAQLAIELQWHPRSEDQAGFAHLAIGDMVKMALAKSRDAVEQATVVVAAPARFWRWLPGYAEEHAALELLGANAEAPAGAKSELLSGPSWDFLFEGSADKEFPERLWAQLLDRADIRSPWAEVELRLFEVKGLGPSIRPRD
jgi:hypothetical protein